MPVYRHAVATGKDSTLAHSHYTALWGRSSARRPCRGAECLFTPKTGSIAFVSCGQERANHGNHVGAPPVSAKVYYCPPRQKHRFARVRFLSIPYLKLGAVYYGRFIQNLYQRTRRAAGKVKYYICDWCVRTIPDCLFPLHRRSGLTA
jgi:hypothetical protein